MAWCRGELQHVDRAETLLDASERLDHRRSVEDVGGKSRCFDAFFGELLGQAGELVLVAGDQGDLEPLLAETTRDGEAQAGACPDDGDGGHVPVLLAGGGCETSPTTVPGYSDARISFYGTSWIG